MQKMMMMINWKIDTELQLLRKNTRENSNLPPKVHQELFSIFSYYANYKE